MVRRQSEAKAKWLSLNKNHKVQAYIYFRDQHRCILCGKKWPWIWEHHVLGRGKLYPPGHRSRHREVRKLNPKYRALVCEDHHPSGHSTMDNIKDAERLGELN